MVLAELGQRITNALASMSAAPVIDEALLDAVLKEIATALLQADVNVRLVANLRNNVKKRVNVTEMAQGLNKQRVIEKVRY
jgi:signal recognition particle subunit SRP54